MYKAKCHRVPWKAYQHVHFPMTVSSSLQDAVSAVKCFPARRVRKRPCTKLGENVFSGAFEGGTMHVSGQKREWSSGELGRNFRQRRRIRGPAAAGRTGCGEHRGRAPLPALFNNLPQNGLPRNSLFLWQIDTSRRRPATLNRLSCGRWLGDTLTDSTQRPMPE